MGRLASMVVVGFAAVFILSIGITPVVIRRQMHWTPEQRRTAIERRGEQRQRQLTANMKFMKFMFLALLFIAALALLIWGAALVALRNEAW